MSREAAYGPMFRYRVTDIPGQMPKKDVSLEQKAENLLARVWRTLTHKKG